MHLFVILGGDILTIDNKAEKAYAARVMRELGIDSLPVFRAVAGGDETPIGSEFTSEGKFDRS